jgi:hypothetical protein
MSSVEGSHLVVISVEGSQLVVISVEGSQLVLIKFFNTSEQRVACIFRMAEFVQMDVEHLTTTCRKTPKDSHHFNNGFENIKLVMINLVEDILVC